MAPKPTPPLKVTIQATMTIAPKDLVSADKWAIASINTQAAVEKLTLVLKENVKEAVVVHVDMVGITLDRPNKG